MTIDEAVAKMESIILGVSAVAEVRALRISDEEARLTVLVPAGDIQAVKDAAFQPVMDFLIEGFDLQVLVYDRDNPTPSV